MINALISSFAFTLIQNVGPIAVQKILSIRSKNLKEPIKKIEAPNKEPEKTIESSVLKERNVVQLPLPHTDPKSPLYGKFGRFDIINVEDVIETVRHRSPKPYFGRKNEIAKIGNFILSPTKNFVVLDGPAGVGKTELITHLAQRILDNDPTLPLGFQGRRILKLEKLAHLPDLINIIENANCGHQYIIVADEIHAFFEDNSLSSMLKSVVKGVSAPEEFKIKVAQGIVPIIGLTDRFQSMRIDRAWDRRIQRIQLNEISVDEAKQAILEKKKNLENSFNQTFHLHCHSFKITDEAIERAILLSLLFYPNQFLPDKTFNLLEPAIACASEKKIRDHVKSGNQEKIDLVITAQDMNEYAIANYKKNAVEIEADVQSLIDQMKNSCIPLTAPLMRYSDDLISLAQRGHFKPAHCRDSELDQIIEILGAREINNALVVGSAGTGKTRLIEGLALRMAQGLVPNYLKNRRLLRVDLNKLLSQNGLNDFLESAKRYKNQFILVIDEVHRLGSTSQMNINPLENAFGNGGSSSHSAGDQLKEMLAQGELPMIGLTTYQEVSALLSNDAMARRFCKISLNPLSEEDAIKVLQTDIKDVELEYAKKEMPFTINQEALEAAVRLAFYFDPKGMLPASAWKLLDCVCSHQYSAINKSNANVVNNQVGSNLAGNGVLQVNQKPIIIDEQAVVNYVSERMPKNNRITAKEMHEQLEMARNHQLPIPLSEPLMQCCEDLTAMAKNGKLSPIHERDSELGTLLSILGASENNNALIIGPAGSGKTRLIEGLAIRMAANSIPQHLKGRQLLRLKPEVLADEKLFSRMLESAKKYKGKFFLVVDEVHRLASKNNSENLKEMLGRGELPLIGMTTEYEARYFIQDPAMSRRFSQIPLNPFSQEVAIKALSKDLPGYISSYASLGVNNLEIEASSIEAAVKLAHHHDSQGVLPASARKLLDLTCSYHINNNNNSSKIVVKEKEVIDYLLNTLTPERKKKLNEELEAKSRPPKPLNLWEQFKNKCFAVAKKVDFFARTIFFIANRTWKS